MSEEVNERSAKHSLYLYGLDVPLNACIDNLDVENFGIIISQRATVTEYPEVLLPRASASASARKV